MHTCASLYSFFSTYFEMLLIVLLILAPLSVLSIRSIGDEPTMLTFGELKKRYYQARPGSFFDTEKSFPDEEAFVKIGLHGTAQDYAESISINGLNPSNAGLLGSRIYTTPVLSVAIMFAIRAGVQSVRSDPETAVAGSVCHLFMPVSRVQELEVMELSQKEAGKIMVKDGYATHDNYQHKVVVLTKKSLPPSQVNFAGSEGKNMLAFCEPIPSQEFQAAVKQMLKLALRRLIRLKIAQHVVNDFKRNSVLSDIKSVDFVKLARTGPPQKRDSISEVVAMSSDGKHTHDHTSLDDQHNFSSSCVFCRKAREIGGEDRVVVFKDIRPAARHHMLAVPKFHHPDSVLELEPSASHISLVKELKEACIRYFEENQIDHSKAKYGFHVPPHISVPHLHLHCLVPPLNFATKFKYSERWFAFLPVDKAIKVLESGRTIKSGTKY
jgi:diadenosine tetraphosphate (Ap4A) HIT family hydrolase